MRMVSPELGRCEMRMVSPELGDLQVGHRLEGDRAYFTGTCPFSFAQFATLGTRRLLGSAMNRYKDNRGSIRAHACVLSEEEPVEPVPGGDQ